MTKNEGFMSLEDEFGIEPESTEQTHAEGGEEATAATEGTEAQTDGVTEGATEGDATAATEGATEGTTEQSTEADTFFENFNTRFGAEFKSDEDIKSLLDSRDELSTLKEQSAQWTEYEQRVKEYDEKIAELEGRIDPLSHFTSKESYIAEQLRRAHPDKDPALLQEVVMKDLKEMSDIDVLAKRLLLDNPDLEGGLVGAKEVIDDKYGINRDDEDYEMSSVTKNRIKIDANESRKVLEGLKDTIEMPTVMTAEEKEQAIAEAKEAKSKELIPYADKFKQFDKWTVDIGDDKKFEFDVPDEFKKGLDGMFKGFFLDEEMELNEKNLETVVELRNAMLLTEYFPKIYEVIQNDAKTVTQENTDALLNNNAPENTSTRTDDVRESEDKSQEMINWLNM